MVRHSLLLHSSLFRSCHRCWTHTPLAMFTPLAFIAALISPAAQQPGGNQHEWHERLSWSSCTPNSTCQSIKAEIVLDSNWRWIHSKRNYQSCFQNGQWSRGICDTAQKCTDDCMLEGVSYESVYGIKGGGNSLSMAFRTDTEYDTNIGSRVFLMANRTRYQTFTLLNNEFAFDVDLSTVGCGINSALYFVEMDADGGAARFPNGTNLAGAEYGMGYCDARCPRNLKYVAGKVCFPTPRCICQTAFLPVTTTNAGRRVFLDKLRRVVAFTD